MTDEQWAAIASGYYGNKPHPAARSLKVRDVPIALELASHLKFGSGDGHASLSEAELFWKEFQPLLEQGVSPQAFHELVDRAASHSFGLHGRPPTMEELKRFADPKTLPGDIQRWYAELPDKHYPVGAGKLLEAMVKAQPHALQHLGRKPVKGEGYLFASGVDPAQHYPGAAQPLRLTAEGTSGGTSGER